MCTKNITNINRNSSQKHAHRENDHASSLVVMLGIFILAGKKNK